MYSVGRVRTGSSGLLTAVAAALAVAVSPPATQAAEPPGVAGITCTLDFWTYQGGYSANGTVTNASSAPVAGWQVSFTKATTTTVNQGWNSILSVVGDRVTIRGTGYAPLQPGATSYFGFTGTVTGVFTPPSDVQPSCVVRVNGRPSPAVLVEPPALTVAEGGSGGFTVRLSDPPTANIVIGMRTSGTGIWAMPPVLLTFTPANWNIPQRLTIMSPEDTDTVDDHLTITISAPGYASATVTATQSDND